jgi:carbon storage regulator
MLVLSRKIGERIFIGPGIEIAIVKVRGSKVQIGIEAPDELQIRRVEAPVESRFDARLSGIVAIPDRA